MLPASKTKNEEQRIKDLLDYSILDTPNGSSYDDLTLLASKICQTPVAIISLVDRERQWFKSTIGLDAKETPREVSICGHAIHGKDMFIVPNTAQDERFADNPVVVGANIQFYAGAPLVSPNGNSIGTLCVVDFAPRELTEDQKIALAALSRQVMNLLELHRANIIEKERFKELEIASKTISENQAQLVNSSKMAEIGEMAAGIAHEVNNPLAIIVASADLLLGMSNEGDVPKEKFQKYLSNIITNSYRASKIILSLKTLSRNADQDPFVPVLVSDVLNETLDICTQRLKSNGVKLDVDVQDGIKFTGKQSQILQVLTNLLNNSYDAIQELEEKWIKITSFKENNEIVIQVTDSGSGIPAEILEKIMQPFFTTKSVTKGTGLGLSVSKRIIDSHKGQFLVDEKNKNTSFVIKLPCSI
jgi:two-component system NtrC family sensor kinase